MLSETNSRASASDPCRKKALRFGCSHAASLSGRAIANEVEDQCVLWQRGREAGSLTLGDWTKSKIGGSTTRARDEERGAWATFARSSSLSMPILRSTHESSDEPVSMSPTRLA